MSNRNGQKRSESVFKQFSAAIKGFIIKQGSSPSEADDLLQDIFYRFLVADGEQQMIDNVSGWLYRVARNLIIDKSRKHREERLPDFVGLREADPSDLTNPENNLANAILNDQITEALQQLPDKQREVFILHEIEGIPFKEISQQLGVPINTLISRKRYAVEQLRKQLSSLREEL